MYIYMNISMDSGQSRMPCGSSGTGMLLTKPYLGTVLKQIDLVSSIVKASHTQNQKVAGVRFQSVVLNYFLRI